MKKLGFFENDRVLYKAGIPFSFLKSLRSKVPKMIPLSEAAIHMSKYIRDDQNKELYDESIYICTLESYIGDYIRDECQRRKIRHKCYPRVIEYSSKKMQSVGYGNIYKIEICDTGLKSKQLADWAITTFNFETTIIPPDDILAYAVWIHPMRDVSVDSGGFDEDGCDLGFRQHLVL